MTKNLLLKFYFFLITFVSLAPIHLYLPGFFEHDDTDYPFFDYIPLDKVGHFIMYFVLGALISKVYPRNRRVLFLGVIYGALMEVFQYFIPYRSFELMDMLANASGIMIILALSHLQKPAQLGR